MDGKVLGEHSGRERASLPPRWFVVLFWHAHRALVRVTGGRVGLWRPKPGGWGALWLTSTGRRTGKPRRVLVGYVEDGDDLVTMAMNGWGPAEPAWWLNLQAQPDVTVRTKDGPRDVHARRAEGAERERLWARWAEIDKRLEAYAARRPHETAVVVLERRSCGARAARRLQGVRRGARSGRLQRLAPTTQPVEDLRP